MRTTVRPENLYFKSKELTNQGRIIVIPLSGLANRLRVVATAVKLARGSNKQLYIYWENNKWLNAVFEDLFEPLNNLILKRPPLKYKIWLLIRSLSLRAKNLSNWYLQLFDFDFVFLDSQAPLVWNNKLDLQKKINESKNVLLATCQELKYYDLDDYKMFIPKPDLLQKINTISEKFSNNTIGIHIRSTDNEMSLKNSPFNIFIKKMEEEIVIDPNVQFFLSTDNFEYQDKILQRFGSNKIHFHEKEFSRNKTKGIKDAVIDLFCLSKTSKIYGSYFSSFSYVPGRIGDIPFQVLKV